MEQPRPKRQRAEPLVQMALPQTQYERLRALQAWIADRLSRPEKSYSLGSLVGLLLDAWERNTPELDWTLNQVQNYPRRGRLPKNNSTSQLDQAYFVWRAFVRDPLRGHLMAFGHNDPRRALEPKLPPWMLDCICVRCGYRHWGSDPYKIGTDGYVPPYTCPFVDPTSKARGSALWHQTKDQLRAGGWDVDDVVFDDHERPNRDSDGRSGTDQDQEREEPGHPEAGAGRG